jgi:exoribonuclease R
LRRLADRYVIEATLQIANGRNVDEKIVDAFQRLPDVMAKAEAKSDQIDRQVLNLAEAVMLEGQEGTRFSAVVTDIDERGARVQLSDPPAIARVEAEGAMPGDSISVELISVDILHRQVKFQRID